MRRFSERNAHGNGWGKKGYRQNGELYFQLRRSYSSFSRQHTEDEYTPINELLRSMQDDVLGEDPGKLPRRLHYEFHFMRQLLEPSDDMISTILDGGETIHAKVFDEEGYEYKLDGYDSWEAKPCRNPVARELIQFNDGHSYWVLATD